LGLDDGPSRVVDSQLGPLCEQNNGCDGLLDLTAQNYTRITSRKKRVHPSTSGAVYERKNHKVKILNARGSIGEKNGDVSDRSS
ncbi:unnamed protein product, partial [Dovyalis caffra]